MKKVKSVEEINSVIRFEIPELNNMMDDGWKEGNLGKVLRATQRMRNMCDEIDIKVAQQLVDNCRKSE